MNEDNRKSLVIVESVAKTKTINKFLGNTYLVLSSVGHLIDLPQRKLGVDIDNGFEPRYILIRKKQQVMRELKEAAADAKQVIIATDPDREGEAIAWHLADVLKKKNDNIHRVLFNEITKSAVTRAIEHPLEINEDRVEAQKARRVMDRLVGYKVSPILWNTLYKGLSAGRVQSVALRLLCEREDEIETFVPQEYWSIIAQFQGRRTDPFESKLTKIRDKKPEIPNEESAKVLVADIRKQGWFVKDIRQKEITKNPYPPFTTSTMQQDAARRLGLTAKRIMIIAQQLYEGIEVGEEGPVGLITYMRTDSTRVADEAVSAVRELIFGNYGKEYLPETPRRYKVRAQAQDAHEAIRPTEVRRTPRSLKKYLNQEQYRLYELIWNRFVASQMVPARLEQTSIDIVGGKDDMYLFRTTGSVVVFRGFMQVYEETKREDTENEMPTALPTELNVGEKVVLLDITPNQHFTKPPPRFSESSLVKELDTLGIGRPSTYATIISTIVARNYVQRNGHQLIPTELGRTVNKILVGNFPNIFDVKFTAKMEAQFDAIEAGKNKFLKVMNDFYKPFNNALEQMSSREEQIRDSLLESTDEECPLCGKKLVVKWGRLGRFMACEDYPECRFTKTADKDTDHIEEKCELCGREMIVKAGRFGRFVACSGYPQCKNSKPFKIGMKCPKDECDGDVIERKSRRGSLFYGCNRYPDCDFISSHRPVPKTCPTCGNNFLQKRYTQAKGEHLKCPQCKDEFAEDMTRVDEFTTES